MVLEFIRLDGAHTGMYLAEQLYNCLKRYGLEKFVHTLTMDNAGNCNTTAMELQKLLPRYLGTAWRIRCFLHIIQLIAKMIISFFFKQYKWKRRKIKVSTSDTSGETEEVIVDGADPAGEEEILLAQLLDEEAAEEEA
jgi:hypothetical protein